MTSDHGPELTDGDLERIANDIMQRHVVLLTDATRLFDGYVALRTQVAALREQLRLANIDTVLMETERNDAVAQLAVLTVERNELVSRETALVAAWLPVFATATCDDHAYPTSVTVELDDFGTFYLAADAIAQAHATRAASAAGEGE